MCDRVMSAVFVAETLEKNRNAREERIAMTLEARIKIPGGAFPTNEERLLAMKF